MGFVAPQVTRLIINGHNDVDHTEEVDGFSKLKKQRSDAVVQPPVLVRLRFSPMSLMSWSGSERLAWMSACPHHPS